MAEQPHEKVEQPLHKILYRNLLGGIAWGLGVTIGATLLLAILGYFLSQANYVPIVGNFVSQVITFVEENNRNVQNIDNLER